MFMVLHIGLTEVRLICISKSKLFASFNLKTCFTFRIVKIDFVNIVPNKRGK